MTRFAFTLLAALGLIAAVAMWWRPADPVETRAAAAAPEQPAAEAAPRDVPEEIRPGAAEQRPEAVAAPAPVPRPPAPSVAEVAGPEPSAAPLVPTEPVRPTLGEEPVEIVSRADFGVDAADAEAADAAVGSEDEEPAAPPAPVDVERSGDLVRRMLALYQTMRE